MVETTTRRQYGQLLRHFFVARCTNDEYEERAEKLGAEDTHDAALGLIWCKVWLTYDDFSEHRMNELYKLDKNRKRTVARWILFLQNDLEYEYPCVTLRHTLRRLMTILTFGKFTCFREPALKDLGDSEVWPFFRVEDYERALHSPKLLGGRSA